MITQQHVQESLSRSFIHAIAGSAGVNLHVGREFDYGFDGTFRPVIIRGKRRVESGFPVDFQLKCTKSWSHEAKQVAYNIETKTYNDLVTRDPEGIGAVLILLCVPDDPAKWVEVCEEYIRMQRCCYYTVLSGDPVAHEGSTKKILIDRTNVLTPDALIGLLANERERKARAAS
ncbi:conserved hypothetical protein [Gluconacetobacter diazotrophicus PA1 5]|uniref:DUF4365 domain-containing protein n=1 Tax=Gluconacetobacter diazotrophicus TaxID=33996 RepID=UPI000181EFE0|nr:DUF4365 domain-containing protein [Gluconacetobacter diazotrophicus]ACI50798.1 conserved hypothetical protein [Gluconacetobacter diazotrophicus PA1 5]